MSAAGKTVQWGVVLDDRGSTELYPEAVARAIAERGGGQLVRVTTEIMPAGPADKRSLNVGDAVRNIKIDEIMVLTRVTANPEYKEDEEFWGEGLRGDGRTFYIEDREDVEYVTSFQPQAEVTTIEDARALPRLTAVLSRGRIWQKLGGVTPYHQWQSPDGGFSRTDEDFAKLILPAVIIHVPAEL